MQQSFTNIKSKLECKQVIDILFGPNYKPNVHIFKHIIITYLNKPMIILSNCETQTINNDLVIPMDNLLYPDEWSNEYKELEVRKEIEHQNNSSFLKTVFWTITWMSVAVAATLYFTRHK